MWDNNQLVPIGIIEARAKVQMLMPAEHDPYESRTAAPLPQE